MAPELMLDSSALSASAGFVEPCWVRPPAHATQLTLGPFASGWEWHDEVGHWCLLTNVTSGEPQATSAEQTGLVLRRMEDSLVDRGLSFADVIRTWFFPHEILRWYETFNSVRTGFLEERQLLGRMPASTAIAPALPSGPRLLAGLLALRPALAAVRVECVASPAQGSAFAYGSSFSRAMEVRWPRGKRLYVSGTASIDAVGRTLHPGRLYPQIEETFRVVQELLESRAFRLDDVTHAVCYVTPGNSGSLARANHYLPQGFSCLEATICRADLEFEIELVAEQGYLR